MAHFGKPSSQTQWIFTPERLQDLKLSANKSAAQQFHKGTYCDVTFLSEIDIDIVEETKLKQFYEQQIQQIAQLLNLPDKVMVHPLIFAPYVNFLLGLRCSLL